MILLVVFLIAVTAIGCSGKVPLAEHGPVTSMTMSSEDGRVGILAGGEEYTYIDRRNGFQVSAPLGTWDIFSTPFFEKPLPSGRQSNRTPETSRYWKEILNMGNVAVVMGGPFQFETPSRGRYKGVVIVRVFTGAVTPERRQELIDKFLRWWWGEKGTESSTESETHVEGHSAIRWDYSGYYREQKDRPQRLAVIYVQRPDKALFIHGVVFRESDYKEFSRDLDFILSSVKFLSRE